MKREVLRIEPRSAVRIGFFVGLLGGFVLGFFEALLFRAVSETGGGSLLPAEAKDLVGSSFGALLLMAVMTGLISSLVVALAGGLTAAFYNLGARWFGGIEVSLNEPPVPQVQPVLDDGEENSDV